ncbi:hypothetical protein D9615_010100 [Tricholomella constricta]|uniref:Uncharacterized protein n=1 Tax=Tricholomella constricta TaxID=117010 RepID=A0A8H5GXI3_9AGAR|nr:hypothetical protein D9615_010100 [Tricholomella constricta]
MTTATKPERRFFGDIGSLRSFGGNGSSSNPPSLKTNSLKARKAMVLTMPTLLGRRRWSQSGDSSDFDSRLRGGIKNKNFTPPSAPTPLQSPKPEAMPSTSRTREISAGAEYNDARDQNKPAKIPRPTMRTKTIIRLISTKFRSHSPPNAPSSPPIHPHSPTQAASGFASKENREAALRERGLLPPLKSNADLSRAEAERDRQLPVLPTPSSEEILAVDGEVRKVSAASRVKEEWEARNKMGMDDHSQRERMKTFKFGALASSPIPKEDVPAIASTPLIAIGTPLPSSDAAPQSSMPESSEIGSPKPSSLRNKRSSPVCRLEEVGSPNVAVLVQHPSAPSESGPFPLPPSPLPPPKITRAKCDAHDILAASVHLPPSPNPSIQVNTLPSPQTPTISLSPPTTFPFLSHAGNSEIGPSDVSTSSDTPFQATTTSTVDAFDFAPTTSLRSRPNALTVKVHDNKIPIIIESPVGEESFLNGSILSPSLSRDPATAIEVTFANESDDTTAEANDDAEAPTHAVHKPRPRNFTEPPILAGLKAPTPERRKSLNPFQRSQTLSPDPSSDSKPNSSRRLSMSASISNMRRSVVGTLSRSIKPIAPKAEQDFDASHLPPSPTIPNSFANQDKVPRSPGPVLMSPTSPKWTTRFAQGQAHPISLELKARQAVSPTLYSRGSILVQTNNIEDEETRRMTELAFLG